MRDPKSDEINTPEFEAIWQLIKYWDIGVPEDITSDGGQLYSHGTGSHVVAILDVLYRVNPLFYKSVEKLNLVKQALEEYENGEFDEKQTLNHIAFAISIEKPSEEALEWAKKEIKKLEEKRR